MTAELHNGTEYGTDKPCQIGRIVYALGVRRYVALAFRYLEEPDAWRLTWIGEEHEPAVRLPAGIAPNAEMLAALAEAA